MKCINCIEKEKTWSKDNDPIECAFKSGVFSPDNWMCGTMDKLRDIAEKNEVYNDDMYAGLVPYEYGDPLEYDSNPYGFGYIYLEWYKSRGKTDKCIDMESLQPLTLETALEIGK